VAWIFGRSCRHRAWNLCSDRGRFGIWPGLGYAGFNAVSMLFWPTVLNGVLAPPLIVILMLLISKPAIMGTRANSRWMAG